MQTITHTKPFRHDGRSVSRPMPDAAGRQGFALVATISMMVVLVVIAVGMLSLSSVSLRSSSHSQFDTEAKANARLALMMAIGELQKQMGPDQRISITADQRMKTGDDGSKTSSVAGKRHWTGVFDSWASTTTNRPTPVFRSWLVSGEQRSLADVENAVAGDDFIELVGAGTVGGTAERVLVPATDLDTPRGRVRLGWWVGDQGVKAALSTQPVSKDVSLAVMRNNLQAAPRNAAELASIGTVKPFANLVPDDPRLPLATSWPQAGFFASDTAAHRPLFHDLVAYSTGLMTNVRAGGFRKDLSMKMETFTSPPDLTDPANVLYYVQKEEGINFLELWAYYNLYKQLQYGGGGSFTTGGSIPASAPRFKTANTYVAGAEDNSDIYKLPATVNYQLVFSFEAATHPTDPTKTALFLNMDPVVTMWNPLDVAVELSQTKDTRNEINGWTYNFWAIPYDINVRINGGAEKKCAIMRAVQYVWTNRTGVIDSNMLSLTAGKAERIILKPGEVIKVSQAAGAVTSNTNGTLTLAGIKGFNYGSGVRYPLIDESNNYILVDPLADQISYTAEPNNLTCGRKDASGGNMLAGYGSGNSRRHALSMILVSVGRRTGYTTPSDWYTQLGTMSVDHCYGYRRLKVGEVPNPSVLYNKTASNSTRVYANDPQYSEIYPMISGPQYTRDLSVAQIQANKAPFMVHTYSVKTEVENQRGTRMFARYNPKVQHVDFYGLLEDERDLMPYQTEMTPLTSWLNAPLDVSTDGNGFFGSSLASPSGSKFVNTHGIPRQPIVSLAAFQDSFANGFNRLTNLKEGDFEDGPRPLLPQISHAIGNSLAPSVIPPDQTEGNLVPYTGAKKNPHPLADHSYLANLALWDDWFLSGIAPQPKPAFSQARDQKTVATEFFTGELKLPVTRYMPYLGGGDASALVNSFFLGVTPNNTAVTNVASHLRVDGMFNVNSTSVEAWKALLGSLKGRQIVVRDENGTESIATKDDLTPIANAGAARNVITTDDASMEREQWYGRRSLSDQEIDSLARAIVKEVRKRGPFLSLADFVNRRVSKDPELAKSGAIQSALDSAEAEVNKKQIASRSVSSSVASRFVFPEAEKGPMHYGSPGIVKQGDVLTPIAPILSARSDSFIIRAYGEAKDLSGKVVAHAWCEAVVERSSDYIDPADAPETLPGALTRNANKEFGRRFNLVSFRWLNPMDI